MEHKNKIKIWTVMLGVTLVVAVSLAFYLGRNTTLFKGTVPEECAGLAESECNANMPVCLWSPPEELEAGGSCSANPSAGAAPSIDIRSPSLPGTTIVTDASPSIPSMPAGTGVMPEGTPESTPGTTIGTLPGIIPTTICSEITDSSCGTTAGCTWLPRIGGGGTCVTTSTYKPNLSFGSTLSRRPVTDTPFIITAAIRNTGIAPAPASRATIIIDINDDRTYEINDTKDVPAIAPDGSVTLTWSRPDIVRSTPGNVNYKVTVDPASTVSESNEEDNVLSNSISVAASGTTLIPPPPMPELAIDFSVTSLLARDFLLGGPVTFSGIIKNNGGRAGSTLARFCVDAVDTCRTSDSGRIGGSDTPVGELATNATRNVISGSFQPLITGSHILTLCANTGVPPLAESNVENNCLSQSFSVGQPDFISESLTISPTTLTIGNATTLTLSGITKNNGNGTSSPALGRFCINNTDCRRSSTNPNGTEFSIPELTASGTSTISATITWTPTTVGSSTLAMCSNTGATGFVSESNFANNCVSRELTIVNPTLTSSITISRDADSPVGTVLTGSENHEAARFSFSNTSTTPVTVTSITVSVIGTAQTEDLGQFKIFDGPTTQIGTTIATMAAGNIITFSPLTLQINAGETKHLSFKTNVLAGATQARLFSFRITSVAATPSGTTLTGLPASGNDFAISRAAEYAARPDLTADSLTTTPATGITAGTTMVFQGRVRNLGSGSASNFTSRFCIDNTNCIGDSSGMISQQPSMSLTAGASLLITSAAWTSTAGTHTAYLCADVNPTIEEAGEDNNCVTAQFTVAQSRIADIGTSTPPVAGTTTPPDVAPLERTEPPPPPPTYRGAAPDLNGSPRIVRAPERGQTGPEVFLYFGILAAIQAGRFIKKKMRK